ncbi:MAG: DEAD/DEAH box helicase [Bacteroidetes bacterium]|nr:DEAD/DEAH box helicase [Bacteroidota bacterium]
MSSHNSIIFSHDESTNEIVVDGSFEKLLSNKRSKLFLKEYLDFTIDETCIRVKIREELNKTIELLKKAASYTDLALEFSSNVSYEINSYLNQEKQFEIYANKALKIRNNDCDLEDFQNFRKSVEKKLTGRVLYPLQFLSAYHLAFAQNACNFSVPGAGKTSIVYGAFSYLSSLNEDHPKKVDRLIILGPLSSFGPWENEFEECFERKPTSIRLSGGIPLEQKKQLLYTSTPPEIVLLSYASLISIKEELKYYLSRNRCMVVLDEAHKIKNVNDGIIAQSALEIASLCQSRVILTGTPAPNGYEDLNNLFRFIWPSKKIIKFNSGQLKDMSRNQNDSRVELLIDSISPFFIRIKKSDLNIPAANENSPVFFEMSASQRRLYDIIEKKFVNELSNVQEKSIYNSLARARMIRLMQVASNPRLLREPLSQMDDFELNSEFLDDSIFLNDIKDLYSDSIPTKFTETGKIVKKIIDQNEKIIIWCCFTKSISGLSEYLKSIGIESRVLQGSTPIEREAQNDSSYEEETRESIIRDFHKPDSSFKVILANSFAVSESISLHKVCHNALYFERSFNASHYIQSKDRIHRYGLPADTITNYYYLLASNSIEETIHQRLFEKEQRLLEIIESMPIPLFNVVEEQDSDINAILRDYARRTKAV